MFTKNASAFGSNVLNLVATIPISVIPYHFLIKFQSFINPYSNTL